MALRDTDPVEKLKLRRTPTKEKRDVQIQTDVVYQEVETHTNFGFDEDHENGIQPLDKSSPTVPEVQYAVKDVTSSMDGDQKVKDEPVEAVVTIKVNSEPIISKRLQILLTVANCIMTMIPTGFLFSLGVLFVNIIDEFQVTRAEASPVLSIYTTVLFGLGGVFGPVMNKFNGGYVCIISGFIAFAGCIISYFATSVVILIFSNGVLTALGLSPPFLLPFVMIGEIFEEKRRGFMITFIGLSHGICAVLFPYLTSYLSENFGWRGTILIYSGLMLNVIPIGLLNAYVKQRLNRTHHAAPPSFKEALNLSLFRKLDFLVVVYCIFLLNTLFPTINQFFVDMVRDKGFDIATGSALLSINGFMNVGGRLFNMLISPFMKCSGMVQWAIYLFIVSVTISFYVIFSDYAFLLGTSIVYGFYWGMCIISYPAMLLEISGQKRYANAVGYTNLIGGVCGLGGATAAAFIKDTTGSYDYVYYGTTALGLLACVLLLITIFRRSRRRKSEMKKEEIESTDL